MRQQTHRRTMQTRDSTSSSEGGSEGSVGLDSSPEADILDLDPPPKVWLHKEELVRVNKTVICPVAEYCAVMYHSQLTDEQDELRERQQSHALKLIYGPKISAGKMREMAGISTLRQTRIQLCEKFAEKAAASSCFSQNGSHIMSRPEVHGRPPSPSMWRPL